MKVLIFSDLHGHNFREFSYINEDGINNRLAEQGKCLDNILSSAEKHDVKQIWFLGDFTHLKNNIDTQVIRFLVDKFRRIINKFPVFILPGNHDYRMWSAEPTLLEMIEDEREDNIFLMNKNTFCSISVNHRVFSMPYTRALSGINDEIKLLETRPDSDIFLGHQDIIGNNYGRFIVEKGLDADLLSKKFKLSLIGHCHNPGKVRENVFSIGSPLQHNFGESGQDKGWWILDTDTYKMKFIKNDFSPKFFKVSIKDNDDLGKIDGDISRDYYWIKVVGGNKDINFDNIRWKRVVYDVVGEHQKRADIKLDDSVEDVIKKYVKTQNVSKLSEDKLIEIGRGYLYKG